MVGNIITVASNIVTVIGIILITIVMVVILLATWIVISYVIRAYNNGDLWPFKKQKNDR